MYSQKQKVVNAWAEHTLFLFSINPLNGNTHFSGLPTSIESNLEVLSKACLLGESISCQTSNQY